MVQAVIQAMGKVAVNTDKALLSPAPHCSPPAVRLVGAGAFNTCGALRYTLQGGKLLYGELCPSPISMLKS